MTREQELIVDASLPERDKELMIDALKWAGNHLTIAKRLAGCTCPNYQNKIDMEAKFKIGDIVKYQNNIYSITKVAVIDKAANTCMYYVQHVASTLPDNYVKAYTSIHSSFEGEMELVTGLKITKKIITEPFNLEKAKQGARLVTYDNRMARIICYDAVGDKPIVALLKDRTLGTEAVAMYYADGSLSNDIFRTDNGDLLIMVREKLIAETVNTK